MLSRPTDCSGIIDVKKINQLAHTDGSLQSPINLSIHFSQQVDLPKLLWTNYENNPKKMKVTNTGHTLIVSGKWEEERPHMSEGPLQGKYVFSQLHFHWGEDDQVGSEHTVDKHHYPLEMHAVHFKSTYLTPESALMEKDGVATMCYLFQIQPEANPNLQIIVDALRFVQRPHTSVRIDPVTIDSFLSRFENDYFLYWGSVLTPHCSHAILWMISRQLIGISSSQMAAFRKMLNSDSEKMIHNLRASLAHPPDDRSVFHVSPSGQNELSTLLPIK